MTGDSMGRITEVFADILDYPQASLTDRIREGADLLARAGHREAASLLREFHHLIEEIPFPRLEETYSACFELTASCCPYVGYQLFGEKYERSRFLLELKKRYLDLGFIAVNGELPDHLVVLLRYLSISCDAKFNEELIREGLLPGIHGMLEGLKEESDKDVPYAHVLRALSLFFESFSVAAVSSPGVLGGGNNG